MSMWSFNGRDHLLYSVVYSGTTNSYKPMFIMRWSYFSDQSTSKMQFWYGFEVTCFYPEVIFIHK